jgi:hypothetical protein
VIVTWPLEFVVPESDTEFGPPVTVTVAPETGEPAQVTVDEIEPVGSASGTVVVALCATDWLVALALWLLFVAVTVYPEPTGTFENVTWPLELVVPESETLFGPPVTVTVAPETAEPPHVTFAVIEPIAYPVSENVDVRSVGYEFGTYCATAVLEKPLLVETVYCGPGTIDCPFSDVIASCVPVYE